MESSEGSPCPGMMCAGFMDATVSSAMSQFRVSTSSLFMNGTRLFCTISPANNVRPGVTIIMISPGACAKSC